jgi:hypothetical protein
MATKEYPYPECGEFADELDLDTEFIASLIISYPTSQRIPCLPFRRNGKLIFPTGTFNGTWTAPEIRQAVSDGAEILKVNWVYSYGKRKCRPFTEWVNHIYGLRRKTEEPFLNYALKIFLNSVFGKFTEAGKLTIYKDGKVSTLENRPPHSNVVLGAYTTAYGRLTLLKALRENENTVCYCDTDSVFLRKAKPLRTGKELGEWKLEGVFERCHFVLPKTYLAVRADGSKITKAKGIPKRSADEFFDSYCANYDSPIRFRESKRRNLSPNVWIKKTRKLSAKYEKRTVLKNGNTLPIVLEK